MPLDKILQALTNEAQRQIAEIERSAVAETERLAREAESEAKTARQRHAPAMQTSLHAEQARILNRAKLQAQRIITEQRESLLAAAIAAAASELDGLTQTESYKVVLRHLIQEAVGALGSQGPLALRGASRDVALLEQIARDSDMEIRVEGCLCEGGLESSAEGTTCLGGVEMTSADGRTTLHNTLQARLERVASLYRSEIAQGLLGERQGD